MNTNLILIKIDGYSYNEVVRFLLKRNIFYKDLTSKDNYVTLIIKLTDYKKVKREIASAKIIKYRC